MSFQFLIDYDKLNAFVGILSALERSQMKTHNLYITSQKQRRERSNVNETIEHVQLDFISTPSRFRSLV